MLRAAKWSSEWITLSTTPALLVAYDVARANHEYSSKFKWARYALAVETELRARGAIK